MNSTSQQNNIYTTKGTRLSAFFVDKLGFSGGVAHCSHSTKRLFRPPFQRWLSMSSGAVQGRVALATAFLLLAFLCASGVKEKRLKTFAIKDLLTLFLLRKQPKKKKLCKKKTGVFALTPRGRPLLKKRCKTFLSRLVCANKVLDKSKFEVSKRGIYDKNSTFHN